MKAFILTTCILVPSLASAGEIASARKVTITEAIDSTRQNNITWQNLGEFLVMAEAGRDIGVGLFLPKLRAEGSWLHLGERHTPDLSAFSQMGALLGDLVTAVVAEHPNQAERFLPYMSMMGSDAGGTFDSFVPKSDTFAATFTVAVPVFNWDAISMAQGNYDRYDSAVQRIGYGREQLLYAVAKVFYGICTMQSMLQVTDHSIASAQEHFKSSQIRASLNAATQLEVKRAELDVSKNESQKIDLVSNLEKTKAAFRYLTGLGGAFELQEPALALPAADKPLDTWLSEALAKRQDLAASHIEILVAEHDVRQVYAQYLPNLNLFGQFKIDNAKEQRFDDDPFSWVVGGSLAVNLWDGGIREAQLEIATSRLRQAQNAQEDLRRKIENEVSAAYQALLHAQSARKLAEHQVDVARDTQKLAKASEEAGAATSLEVIDVNTMVFASEAQFHASRMNEAMAILDLLASCGYSVPFGANTDDSASSGDRRSPGG